MAGVGRVVGRWEYVAVVALALLSFYLMIQNRQVTPTYSRPTQLLDLHKLSHTLYAASFKHNIFWVVVEDSAEKTGPVSRFLADCSVNHAHLAIKEVRPANAFKANTQRNFGIEYIRRLNPHPDSKAYFADDDNVYALALFDEIAKVKNVGVWPVAYSGARRVEYPIVQHGRVTGFFAYNPSFRHPFPLDMAGFAVSVRYFLREDPVKFEELAPTSTGENRFLLATGMTVDTLEPLADECTRVYVWHVKTVARLEAKYTEQTSQFVDV